MKQCLVMAIVIFAMSMNLVGSNSIEKYRHLFEGKNILVTGGTGTLGSAVIKELLKYNPKKIIIFSRDEAKHFRFLESMNNNPILQSYLGDVRDYEAVYKAAIGVDIIIHTAALKRVDSIESNVEESIKTNVLGSANIFNAGLYNRVPNVVYVSTDKSCSPISAYGAGKFLGEKIFSNYNFNHTATVFTAVRFGNIVGSNGSILPIFLEKIKRGDDIPLTDVKMTRFMITPEEAAEVIFDSIKYGKGGEIFVKQVPSIRISDFIDVLISKLQSKSRVNIIGLRAGERLYESLISDVEIERTYEYQGNYIITPSLPEWNVKFVTNQNSPIYVSNGTPLKYKISKELSSHDYVISRDELHKWFDQFNIVAQANKTLLKTEGLNDDYSEDFMFN